MVNNKEVSKVNVVREVKIVLKKQIGLKFLAISFYLPPQKRFFPGCKKLQQELLYPQIQC
jgi:hypothetical protein